MVDLATQFDGDMIEVAEGRHADCCTGNSLRVAKMDLYHRALALLKNSLISCSVLARLAAIWISSGRSLSKKLLSRNHDCISFRSTGSVIAFISVSTSSSNPS